MSFLLNRILEHNIYTSIRFFTPWICTILSRPVLLLDSPVHMIIVSHPLQCTPNIISVRYQTRCKRPSKNRRTYCGPISTFTQVRIFPIKRLFYIPFNIARVAVQPRSRKQISGLFRCISFLNIWTEEFVDHCFSIKFGRTYRIQDCKAALRHHSSP